jgi:enoyl-CoA hydratase
MTPFEHLSLERHGGVATLTLRRPQALNALNAELLDELGAALHALHQDDTLRALVLTGDGKAFVAGADIVQMADMTPLEAERFSRRGQAVMSALETLPVPALAAVNGYALGGGCELALACDLIYASQKARFGQPEVNLGVIPGFGGTQRLTRRVGPTLAAELIYTGRLIDADEAVRIGLAARQFAPDALLEEVHKIAHEIAAKGPLAVRRAKQLLREGADLAIERANSMEATAFAACFATQDQREGMRAFLDKRPPTFHGA